MSTLKRKFANEQTFQISIEWVIKEDEIIREAEGNRLMKSPQFGIPGLPDVKYFLQFKPKYSKKDRKGKAYGYVYLILLMPKDMNIHATVNTSCKSASFSYTLSHIYTFSEGWGHPLCPYNDLIDPTKKFIVDKKLIINVTATLKVHEDVTPVGAKKPKNERSLGFILWESESDKDVRIVVDNENELKAHKYVLKRRSSKFAALLDVKPEPGTSAKTESKIFVQNKAFNTVKEAIMYCYDIQNSDTLSAEDAANMLIFAAEYEIVDLKENMEEFCIENLSVSNACFFANSSITAKSDKLKNACFGFLANCMKTETYVKDIEKLNAEMKESLFLRSFCTIVE